MNRPFPSASFVVRQDDMDDREEFHAVDKALSSLDFSVDEKTDMWRLLAAILHSGEVRYAPGGSLGSA